MTLQSRHLGFAVALHAILFFFIFVGVQCSQPVETPPVVQGVLINPNDLKALKPPTPPTPTPPKPEDLDQGPQQIVKDTDVVADQAKIKREQAAAEQQKKLDEQKAEEQQKAAEAAAQAEKQKLEQAKAEELKRQQDAQKQAEAQAAAQKKQQEEAQRKAAEQAAADQRKKELDEQVRKEAEQQQKEAQAAAIAKQKKAEEAQREADRRKRAEELQKSLGVESAQMTAQVQNEWMLQLSAAIQQAWAWPPGTDPKTKAWLKIRLSPTGQVISAEIATPSGITLFDQTLKQAAYKASPLPLPRDPSAFDSNLTVCFSPNPQSCNQ
jgi:colicin import membrane protein